MAPQVRPTDGERTDGMLLAAVVSGDGAAIIAPPIRGDYGEEDNSSSLSRGPSSRPIRIEAS